MLCRLVNVDTMRHNEPKNMIHWCTVGRMRFHWPGADRRQYDSDFRTNQNNKCFAFVISSSGDHCREARRPYPPASLDCGTPSPLPKLNETEIFESMGAFTVLSSGLQTLTEPAGLQTAERGAKGPGLMSSGVIDNARGTALGNGTFGPSATASLSAGDAAPAVIRLKSGMCIAVSGKPRSCWIARSALHLTRSGVALAEAKSATILTNFAKISR
jgi:hypothetical protein